MTISINLLQNIDLMSAVSVLGGAADFERENFLLNNVFKVNPQVHFSNTLVLPQDIRRKYLQGYSRKRDGATPVGKASESTETIEIPKIRRSWALDEEFLTMLSLVIGGYNGPLATNPNTQIAAKINRELVNLMAIINAQSEATAAEILMTGSATLTYPDSGSDTLDFNYTGNGVLDGDTYTIQKDLSGTSKWDSTSGDPVKDLRRLRRLIDTYAHWAGPVMVLAGYEACDALLKRHAAVVTPVARLNTGSLSLTAQAKLQGAVAGIPIYEYVVTSDTDATTKNDYIDSKTIAMVADGGENCTTELGPVFDFADQAAMTPSLLQTAWFSKFVKTEDPPVTEIIVERRPLPLLRNPNKVRVLKVL